MRKRITLFLDENILRIFLAVFMVLCVNYFLRDMIKAGRFAEYKELLNVNAEGKLSIVYGDGLLDFLKFARENIPPGSSYNLEGPEKYSLLWRRAVYYLYPLKMSGDPGYILVCNSFGYIAKGYSVHARMDELNYILKRKNADG